MLSLIHPDGSGYTATAHPAMTPGWVTESAYIQEIKKASANPSANAIVLSNLVKGHNGSGHPDVPAL